MENKALMFPILSIYIYIQSNITFEGGNVCLELDKRMLLFYWQCQNVYDVIGTEYFQYQTQFVDTHKITRWDQNKNFPKTTNY